MRPRPVVTLAVLAVVLAAVAGATASPSGARQGTPGATPDGITITELAAPEGTPALARPDRGGDGPRMILYRITVAPGAAAGPHPHAGAAIMLVESGSILFTAEEGAVFGQCADGCLPGATPAAEPAGCAGGCDLLPAGMEVRLEPGDWVVQYDTATHAYRNDGAEPAVILVTALYVPGVEEGCAGGCE